jgi:hypothetical protein
MDAQSLVAAAMTLAMMTITVSLFAAEPGIEGAAQTSTAIYGHRMTAPQERD